MTYRTIVADPPWSYSSKPPSGKSNRIAAADGAPFVRDGFPWEDPT